MVYTFWQFGKLHLWMRRLLSSSEFEATVDADADVTVVAALAALEPEAARSNLNIDLAFKTGGCVDP